MMKELLEQDFQNYKDLKAQYEKEVKDAKTGTGMCAGMPKMMRKSIICDLENSIRSLSMTLNKIEAELRILNMSDEQLMHWYMTFENTDTDFYPEIYVTELINMSKIVLDEMKKRKLDGEPFIRYKSFITVL